MIPDLEEMRKACLIIKSQLGASKKQIDKLIRFFEGIEEEEKTIEEYENSLNSKRE